MLTGQVGFEQLRSLGPIQLPITVVICSVRPDNIKRNWQNIVKALRDEDIIIIIFNLDRVDVDDVLVEELTANRAEVIFTGRDRGLSYSRNLALNECSTQHMIYIDDDVIIYPETIKAIRAAFQDGAQIVGVLISGPRAGMYKTWFISKGQWHYLGVHNPKSKLRTWGACMGFDMHFANDHNLSFREELGYKNGKIILGDDTTFIQEMKDFGARETFLENVVIHHEFDSRRVSLFYLLRRAFACGQAEMSRRNVIEGIKKEWKRYMAGDNSWWQRWLLACLFISAVMSGVINRFIVSQFYRNQL